MKTPAIKQGRNSLSTHDEREAPVKTVLWVAESTASEQSCPVDTAKRRPFMPRWRRKFGYRALHTVELTTRMTLGIYHAPSPNSMTPSAI